MKRAQMFAIVAALALVPALAQAQNAELSAEPMTLAWSKAELYFNFDVPYMVQSYAVTCQGDDVKSLVIGIRDCCMPGDNWEVKAHLYDDTPVDAAVCASGDTGSYRYVAGNSDGNPIVSIVNIRYPHGVNVFPAGVYVKFACWPTDAQVEVVDLGQMPDVAR